MPSIYQLKPAFQALLRPIVRGLARAGVSANQVTAAALALSAGGGAAIALAPTERWPLLMLPAVLFVRMALNAIDGMLAREHAGATAGGQLFNELGDVVADAALYLPLALVPGLGAPLLVAAVTLGLVAEMAGALGPTIGASRRFDGPLGKSDRAFVIGAVGLALGLGAAPGPWLDWLWGAFAALASWTVLRRSRASLAERRP